MRSLFFLFVLSLSILKVNAQEQKIGDSTVVDDIKKITSKIYDNKDKTHFFLTKSSLRQMKTFSTNITAYSKEKAINRIVAFSTLKSGILATEWYFQNNTLVYVYESFEYFDENKPKDGWKNFKGLYAWENRYYFVDEEVKYQKLKGIKSKKRTPNDVLIEGKKMLTYIKNHE